MFWLNKLHLLSQNIIYNFSCELNVSPLIRGKKKGWQNPKKKPLDWASFIEKDLFKQVKEKNKFFNQAFGAPYEQVWQYVSCRGTKSLSLNN